MSALDDFPRQAAELFGVTINDAQRDQFERLMHELIAWNETTNLTAITAPAEVVTRHFLDSLSLVKALDLTAARNLIDVGTGAGFPALPLALVFPHLRVTAMDATAKKLKFVAHMAQTLKLSNLRTLHARAEDAGRMSAERGQYEVVVARAVARLPALLEYTLPLARREGHVVAMKGKTIHDELNDAQSALKTLGGEVTSLVEVHLPGLDAPHYLLTVRKARPTGRDYPRAAGTPTRHPL